MASDKLSGKKILILEDDIFLHTLLADKMAELRNQGAEIFPALNARDALKWTQTSVPDVILLDIVMPEMNGFEFLQKVRDDERLKNVQVIILSNLSQESDKQKAKDLGVEHYYVKADLSLDEITKLIADLLQKG